MQKRIVRKIDTEDKAYAFALKKLSYKDYSEQAMLTLLAKEQCPSAVQQAVLAKLKEYSFLNDEVYAARVYRAWLNKKYYGKKHLLLELKKKEVSEACTAEVLAEYDDELDYNRACNALTAWQKQYNKQEDPLSDKLLAKAIRALFSRGFNNNSIQKALRRLEQKIVD
ncbi:MAG TPA: RecX family transcriptional regulator [Candidatus Avacidaminococcus intestinavium]|uniref:Regulatory protein RecX n=1 Tax=Candidatus Avacidaminococcus intestinavium TaxID=2840684 RepID=A0A9D1SL30_9FIRM|nr:RecX family transcriptional regulator [Candidatus Avacidaminococcus intestinavium]